MRLNQVTVPLTDYAKSVAFYRLLGLKLIVDSPPRYARFELPEGDGGEPATFSIEKVDGWTGGANLEKAWPEIWLETDRLDQTVVSLKAAGIAVEGPVDTSYLWREAQLRDPAGNRIKLYFAGVNRRYPPWRVKD
jgi:catechol 2,3-dioxygenase-like lactoylglutathione lyase family enzyme